jgi:hypothetical protein
MQLLITNCFSINKQFGHLFVFRVFFGLFSGLISSFFLLYSQGILNSYLIIQENEEREREKERERSEMKNEKILIPLDLLGSMFTECWE